MCVFICAGLQEVTNLVTQGHYQLACTKVFELTHNGVIPDGGVNHPNQYFEQSQAVLSGKLDNIKKEDCKCYSFILFTLLSNVSVNYWLSCYISNSNS